jgi:5'(3')-deoxyribonucleotidase
MKKVRVLKGRKYTEKMNVYLDMDGVIADFNNEPNALERFATENGFFRDLKVMNKWAVNQLLAMEDVNVFILSASPNKQADKDKKAWLKYYYPQIKRNQIIFCRVGQNKADYMKTEQGILLDDYGKNCEQWRERGNTAVQVSKPLEEHFNEFMIMNILDY